MKGEESKACHSPTAPSPFAAAGKSTILHTVAGANQRTLAHRVRLTVPPAQTAKHKQSPHTPCPMTPVAWEFNESAEYLKARRAPLSFCPRAHLSRGGVFPSNRNKRRFTSCTSKSRSAIATDAFFGGGRGMERRRLALLGASCGTTCTL